MTPNTKKHLGNIFISIAAIGAEWTGDIPETAAPEAGAPATETKRRGRPPGGGATPEPAKTAEPTFTQEKYEGRRATIEPLIKALGPKKIKDHIQTFAPSNKEIPDDRHDEFLKSLKPFEDEAEALSM